MNDNQRRAMFAKMKGKTTTYLQKSIDMEKELLPYAQKGYYEYGKPNTIKKRLVYQTELMHKIKSDKPLNHKDILILRRVYYVHGKRSSPFTFENLSDEDYEATK